ncbi:PAS domain S-box protein [Marinobacterium litorale]|uniref:PAS domain S-box protein n=1 Tax=Marinobacterium litorale TaxID=404770 RepID=UPI00042813FB|nr:PAS domain S-box protein [Marinobacterium litorale]
MITTLGLCWGIYRDYQNTLERAGERLQIQLRAYASAMDIAFLGASHSLQKSRDLLEQQITPETLGGDIRPALLTHLLESTYVDGLTIYNRRGRVVLAVGNRESAYREMPPWVARSLVQNNQSVIGSSDGRIGVTQLINGADGAPWGVVVAVINNEAVANRLESGDGFRQQNLMLLDAENRPVGDRSTMAKIRTTVESFQNEEQFSLSGTRVNLDGDYLYVLRQLEQQPIRAFAFTRRSDALQTWESRTAGALAAALAIWLISFFFLRYWRMNALREHRVANDLSHLYQAIDQMPSSILITDLDSRIIYANAAYLERSGYRAEQVVGEKPSILSSGKTRPDVYRSLWRQLRKGMAWEGEFINRLANGQEVIEQALITPVRDLDGSISSYFAITSDITRRRESEERLFRYEEIVNASTELLALIDREYIYLQVNKAYLDYHGFDRTQIESHSIRDLWGSEVFENVIRSKMDQAFSGMPVSYESWFEYPRKGWRFCKVSVNPVVNIRGRIDSAVVTISDITDRRRSEESLRISKQRFRTLSEFAPLGIFETDYKGRNIYANKRCADIFGLTPPEMNEYGWASVFHADDQQRVYESWMRCVQRGDKEWSERVRIVDGNEIRWVQGAARRLDGDSPEDARYIGIALDISDETNARKQLEQKNRELEYLSTTDRLTGLNNRANMDSLLQAEIQRYERYGSGCAVIMLDVDYFKQVNDTCGHAVGDQVLVTISKTLRNNTRRSDYVGRWGGEEFLIVCPHTNRDGAVSLAESLRERIDEAQFPVIGHRTCSFGVAELQPGDQPKDILKRADDALYLAKNNGRNRVESETPPKTQE